LEVIQVYLLKCVLSTSGEVFNIIRYIY
jgi:hypothetical protein